MASKKRPRRPSLQVILDEIRDIRAHGVILEDIRSQNRATIEAVQATRVALEERIERVDEESRARDSVLEAAIRNLTRQLQRHGTDIRRNSKDIRHNSMSIEQNSQDIRQNSKDIEQNSIDIRALAGRVEVLGSMEQRVSALEQGIP